ncbi:hypothetical protein CASFOL_013706 [Castilleja foliolosa]|uniref:Trypsin-like serine protease n=1 Tax=Castilleja foliolosa TaxID=1961234 RepID=A0ABD3DKS3_9LAMI
MASSIQSLNRFLMSSSASALKYVPTRGFSQPSSPPCLKQLDSYLQDIQKSLSPSIVSLESSFSDREIHHSRRRGTGVFLEPNLIVTSAHVVGRVTAFYESKAVEKPDRFEHGCIRHRSYIGNTVAHTIDGKMLETKPLAVNFANDLAILKVVKPEGAFSSHCALSSSVPRKDDILMAISHRHKSESVIVLGDVRAIREKTVITKAPWPLDDELRWIEHNLFMFGDGKPQINPGEKVTGSITKVTGSPWFNLHSEVVGIASWEVKGEPAHCSVGFAVPSLYIRTVLAYAKSKGVEDPIVMDRWIDAHVAPGIDT